jgi:hypothetical protein
LCAIAVREEPVMGARTAEASSPYADQNERDHAALVDAVTSGRLTAERDL